MEETESTATEQAEQAAGAEQAKTYTAEEVAELIQREADKRVTSALKTANAKHQKELNKAQSLAQLDGAEREKAEQAAKIAELEEALAGYRIEATKSEIKSVLSARGLSAEFADLLNIGEDAEEAQCVIDALDRLFKDAVKVEVEKRLQGATPKGNNGAGATMTRETFGKLSMREQQELYTKNPEFYKQFI